MFSNIFHDCNFMSLSGFICVFFLYFICYFLSIYFYFLTLTKSFFRDGSSLWGKKRKRQFIFSLRTKKPEEFPLLCCRLGGRSAPSAQRVTNPHWWQCFPSERSLAFATPMSWPQTWPLATHSLVCHRCGVVTSSVLFTAVRSQDSCSSKGRCRSLTATPCFRAPVHSFEWLHWTERCWLQLRHRDAYEKCHHHVGVWDLASSVRYWDRPNHLSGLCHQRSIFQTAYSDRYRSDSSLLEYSPISRTDTSNNLFNTIAKKVNKDLCIWRRWWFVYVSN